MMIIDIQTGSPKEYRLADPLQNEYDQAWSVYEDQYIFKTGEIPASGEAKNPIDMVEVYDIE